MAPLQFLEVLHPTPPGSDEQCVLDIVFVHGLNPTGKENHAEATWMHANGTMWPRDLLPQSIPNARILLFGYNSNVSVDSAGSHLKNHADTLLERLRNRRLDQHNINRSILFICHSLGGLLVKQAITSTRIKYESYGALGQNTAGIMFFGTPHKGSDLASFAKAFANVLSVFTGQPRNSILETLKNDSLISESLATQFMPELGRIPMLTFFEMRKSSFKKHRSRLMQPVSTWVVRQASATLGVPGENVFGIDECHSDMCKFSGLQASDYIDIVLPFVRKVMPPTLATDLLTPEIQMVDAPNRPEVAEEEILRRVSTRSEQNQETSLPERSQTLIHVSRLVGDQRGPDFSAESLEHQQSQVSEVSATDITPSFFVPFESNPHFTGRTQILSELGEFYASQKKSRKAVLYGMGGVGKTQCAIEYCHSYRTNYPHGVLWIQGESEEAVNQSARAIMEELGIHQRTHDHEVLRSWIRIKTHLLVVFDNLSQPNVVGKLIPSNYCGDLLVTTRDSALVGSDQFPFGILIPDFDQYFSSSLFLRSLHSWSENQRKQIEELFSSQPDFREVDRAMNTELELVAERYEITTATKLYGIFSLLGGLPLAIVQCASYLRHYPMPLFRYIDKFQQAEPEARRRFLSHYSPQSTYRKSIMTTWDISFAKLEEELPFAARLLVLLGFLNRSHIDESFLRRLPSGLSFWGGAGHIAMPLNIVEHFGLEDSLIDEAIGRLISMSLVQKKHSPSGITVHPLVHEWIHLRMTPTECALVLDRSLALLYHGLPPLLYSRQDLHCPKQSEEVFTHLDRIVEMTEMYEEYLTLQSSVSIMFFLETFLWCHEQKYIDLATRLMRKIRGKANAEIILLAKEVALLSSMTHTRQELSFNPDEFDSDISEALQQTPKLSKLSRFVATEAIISSRLTDFIHHPSKSRFAGALGSGPRPTASMVRSLRKEREAKYHTLHPSSENTFIVYNAIFALSWATDALSESRHLDAASALSGHLAGADLGVSHMIDELQPYYGKLVESHMRSDNVSTSLNVLSLARSIGQYGHLSEKRNDMFRFFSQHREVAEVQSYLDTLSTDLGLWDVVFPRGAFSDGSAQILWLEAHIAAIQADNTVPAHRELPSIQALCDTTEDASPEQAAKAVALCQKMILACDESLYEPAQASTDLIPKVLLSLDFWAKKCFTIMVQHSIHFDDQIRHLCLQEITRSGTESLEAQKVFEEWASRLFLHFEITQNFEGMLETADMVTSTLGHLKDQESRGAFDLEYWRLAHLGLLLDSPKNLSESLPSFASAMLEQHQAINRESKTALWLALYQLTCIPNFTTHIPQTNHSRSWEEQGREFLETVPLILASIT